MKLTCRLWGIVSSVLMSPFSGPKPMRTDFGIHQILESCDGYWLIFFTITTKIRKARIKMIPLRLLRFHLPIRHVTFKESKLFWKEDFSAIFVCIHFPRLSNYKRDDRSMPDYTLLPFPIFINLKFFIDLYT